MSHRQGLSAWTAIVSTNLPHLTTPQATVLALWSYGIVFCRSCGRTTVATFLALILGQSAATIAQRLREWCYDASDKAGTKRRELDVSSCFAPLLAWVLRLWTTASLALALDATNLDDRLIVLSLSVVYRGCAIAVAWTIVAADQKGSWRRAWLRMLRQLRSAVPPELLVLVLADRGLYARWLFRRIVRLGWHPFLRVKGYQTFRPAGKARFYHLRDLVPSAGRRWQGSGTAFQARASRLECTLSACWEQGHSEPWFVLTDLAPAECMTAWYGLRAWCEQGFKCLKRGAWQWQHTRMNDPARASRLWLALAVATLWMLSVGGEMEVALQEAGANLQFLLQQSVRQPRLRQIRVLRLGWLWLLVQLGNGRPLPLPQRLQAEAWPMLPAVPKLPGLLEDSQHVPRS